MPARSSASWVAAIHSLRNLGGHRPIAAEPGLPSTRQPASDRPVSRRTQRPILPPAVSALDALFHLLNFMLVPALYGGVAGGLVKLAWYERLHPASWLRLASWSTAGALLGQVAGVLATGREGTMTGYALMLAGGLAGLLWAGRGGLLLRS